MAEEAKEKGFPAATAGDGSSNSAATSSGMEELGLTLHTAVVGEVMALDTSKADTLHDLARNSMGSVGPSGGGSKTGGLDLCSGVLEAEEEEEEEEEEKEVVETVVAVVVVVPFSSIGGGDGGECLGRGASHLYTGGW